ncbi:MAG: hypothetical protein ACKVWR_18450 [Acidimicrobiales bacterium]
MTTRVLRLAVSWVLALVLAAPVLLAGAPAGAQGAGAGDSSTTLPDRPRSIPRPNSGQAPEAAGDRGGWLQVSLFWLMCAALVLLALLAWRDSVRKRARRTAPAQTANQSR